MKTKIFHLGNKIDLIDLYDLNEKERTGSYIIKEKENIAVIETSASPSIPYLLNGLEQLHIDPKQITYIIVTHIHLDHAGGVGLFLQHCPNAKVVVHPRGARHLANPEKLIAGSREVYGEEVFAKFYEPVLPVPEERIIVKHDQETLKLSDSRTLTFYDTPGHAKHHFSIYDSASNGMFVGDTVGIYSLLDKEKKLEFIFPATSPNQFDPLAMLRSIEQFEKMELSCLYFGHFGMTTNANEAYRQAKKWIPHFVDVGKKIFHNSDSADFNELTEQISDQLYIDITAELKQMNVPSGHYIYEKMKYDLTINAMGIVDYLMKNK